MRNVLSTFLWCGGTLLYISASEINPTPGAPPLPQDIDTFMKGMEAGKRGHTFAKVDDTLEKLMPAGARGVKQDKDKKKK